MNDTASDDESYFLLGTGTWRGLLPRVPRPVLAVGSKSLYRVLLEGSLFKFSIAGSDRPIIGFFTTRLVAARNRLEAEAMAKSSVLREWERQGFASRAGAKPSLSVETSEMLSSRFRLRSGAGFAFFGDAGDV